ncbi:DNA repair protein RecO [bacterium (Candidatus Gribaldobacteria) CG07_land_8_20_14_0_80_33_18]|uniref:DNA repair protein RecO n=1 Tax=bacterium (Candidatus Gribaldobacteria) CG07_land_8_20_14_0_80_33_18 TaxID=2014272 RepID=A0A2M6Z3H7_9BACT|nr:MAG: DNA repair protein RecO [bacterium (Candidatus Gribaldobacteria) CG07_land_8_20_14_0_80_33_18]PJA00376.1 MAG: DNA repair protein RecO [bacterium (Candidatus Gribaldobacteria) CG_4_10_14_0_2_um_filter_33_15]PJB08972.1 MAG: DNA repair protein RecO [bacterium (Candidatus Gribaldobacteria) CG_4_9_14_3_um_filter_33_9]
MFLPYQTEGFVLKKEDQAEADQLFTIFSKDFGKIKILGKAIRKITSKLRAGMELFYLSQIEFIQGKTYKILTEAMVIDKFKEMRENLERLNIAFKISEDLDNLLKGEEQDEKIWQLLLEVFEKLNNLQLIYHYFFWNFISILGYKPELYFCASCQKKLKPEKLYFSVKEGGLICKNCFNKFDTGIEININAIKILRLIIKKDWKILEHIKINDEDEKCLEIISQNAILSIRN